MKNYSYGCSIYVLFYHATDPNKLEQDIINLKKKLFNTGIQTSNIIIVMGKINIKPGHHKMSKAYRTKNIIKMHDTIVKHQWLSTIFSRPTNNIKNTHEKPSKLWHYVFVILYAWNAKIGALPYLTFTFVLIS